MCRFSVGGAMSSRQYSGFARTAAARPPVSTSSTSAPSITRSAGASARRKAEDRGEEVGADRPARRSYVPGLDASRPADDARDADAALVHRPLPAAQAAGAAAVAAVQAVALRAVVRGEEDERGVGELLFVQRSSSAAEGVVELRDVAVMLAHVLVGRSLVRLLKLRVGLDRQVRLVRPDGQEERLPRVAPVREPLDRLIDDQRRGISLRACRPACRCGRSWSGPCGSGRRCSAWPSSGRSRGRPAAAACGRLNLPFRCHLPTWQVA